MDTDDFAFGIQNERGAVGDPSLFIQHAVQLGHLAVVIGEQRIFRSQFFRPMIQGGDEIRADGYDLRVRIFEFANTRLVGCKLSGSTSGKRGREEGQHDVFLAPVIGEPKRRVIGSGQREIGRLVSYLEIGVLAALLDLLRQQRRGG